MKKRVPYEVIVAAKAEDSEAMEYIMKFYDLLMNHLCKESDTDANGQHYEKVNEDLKAKLMQHMRKQIIEVYDITGQPPDKRAWAALSGEGSRLIVSRFPWVNNPSTN